MLYLFDLLVIKSVWRKNAGAVAGMDAGLLYMLHNAAYHHIVPVRHCVNIDLNGVLQEFVDEDGMLRRSLHSVSHVISQRVLVVDYLHSPAAQHIRWANHHWIRYPFSDLSGFLDGVPGVIGRLV